jgi:hypothetical protein
MTLQSAYFDNWGGDSAVLIWGDAAGMRDLTDFLRNIHIISAPSKLSTFCKSVDGKEITVRMVSDRYDSGMRVNREKLDWALRPQEADDFAEKVSVLISSPPGHQYLECSATETITVIVSTGEYPASLHPDR